MSTAAQLAANLANAQASTGPKSEEGKNRSSLNALKTGLTGRTVLMPGEEAQAYQDHVCRFIDEFAPANAREEEIVQSLADTRWRLLRIPALESNIYALGQLEFGEKFSIEAGPVAAGLIQAHTFLTYQKQFNNLAIQEMRLCRRFEKEMAELKQIQAERFDRERRELDEAAGLYLAAKQENKPFDPAEFGFEFSTQQIEAYLEHRAARIPPSRLCQAA
ncbi:MAG TPA: hypothetical protein VN737_19995 [Bryobacteraceae bacterium]|nr:hypothetical protein [Bryobacteraceae bacterium]